MTYAPESERTMITDPPGMALSEARVHRDLTPIVGVWEDQNTVRDNLTVEAPFVEGAL